MKRVAKEELSALVEKDWEYKLRDTGVQEQIITIFDTLITTTVQKTKSDWLRSEIERLESSEKMKSKIGFEKDGTKMQQIKQRVYAQGHNQALTSIITRYKEELKELEKGV